MRGTFAGLLTLGLVGSPLAAQVEAPPKPPANPPAATQPVQPPKPGATPPVKKAKTGKIISFSSFSPVLVKGEWMALEDEDQIEIKDITVRDFFELIQAIGSFGIYVIKDNLKNEMMPQTILLKRGLGDFIFSLDKIADDFEVKYVEGSAEVIVVSAKPKPAGKPNILFVPVSLDPLLFGIGDNNAKEKKIADIKMVIERGLELDAQVRGLKPTVPLKMMVHPETNLLFVAGQTEQVEAASKILFALGARTQPQDMMGGMGGGWGPAPGGAGMGAGGLGGPVMGGPGGGMGMGMPGMGGGFGTVPGGVPSNLPGAAPGGIGGPRSRPGGAPAPKPQPGAGGSLPAGGGDILPEGNGLPVGR